MCTILVVCAAPLVGAAQEGDAKKAVQPEISGVVIDPGVGRPVGDVDVSLVLLPSEGPRIVSPAIQQNIVQTAKTDINGSFSFKVDKMGEYRVLVNKEGYRPSTPDGASASVTLDSDHPRREVRFEFVRPGEISGRVVYEDTKQPVPSIRVYVVQRQYFHGRVLGFSAHSAFTDTEGRFVVRELQPGGYLVRTGSRVYAPAEGKAVPDVRERGLERMATQFSEDDLKAVDWDYRVSWWPGGAPDAAEATALPLGSGGSVDLGDLTVRKQPVYRVRVSVVAPSCGSGDVVSANVRVVSGLSAVMGTTVGEAPCGKDILMRGFAPGSYRVELAVDRKDRSARERGSLLFVVTDKNIDISVPVTRGIDVEGRIVLSEGAHKPQMEKITPRLNPLDWAPFAGEESNPVDSEGRFRIVNAAVRSQRLGVSGLANPFYVKEVRYNGSVVSDNVLSLDAHATTHSLEIVVDDKPATILGSVTERDRPMSRPHVVLAKWPLSTLDPYSSLRTVTGDENGKFQFAGLPPGEYRLFSVPAGARDKIEEPGVLNRALSDAEKITLTERAFRNVNLESTELR